MEIKKGDWFRCIENNDIAPLKKGDYVQADRDNIIIVVGTHIDHHFTGASVNDYFTKLYTIQDLKDGKVELHNTGTVEELNRVLNSAFPNCFESNGSYSFYNALGSAGWRGSPVCNLPTQSVKDFLAQLPEDKENPFKGNKEESDLDFTMPPIPVSGTIKGSFTPIEDESNTNSFDTITQNLSALLKYKNKKYGNSALEPLNIFSGKSIVGDRLDDKLARVKNGKELRKNDIADLLGYLILTCREKGWETFNELMD